MPNVSWESMKDNQYNQYNRYQSLKTIYKLNRRMSWIHRLQGIDISRCFEYAEAYVRLALVQKQKGRVLDIGSYRSPFPAFLVQQGYQVVLVDLDPVVMKQKKWISKVTGNSTSYLIIRADGTRLPFLANSFDFVTCISTIEHVPGSGDRAMAMEIGRVLRPGGYCFISVPYSTPAKIGVWGRWFQRWYDIPTAMENLVEPSGLSISAIGFLMGGIVGKISDIWYSLPRPIRHLLSWSHIFLFPKFFEKDTPGQYDARLLWILLQK